MSSLAALVLLWALAGILLGIRWWREQEAEEAVASGTVVAERTRFGSVAEDGSPKRVQAMRAAYLVGAGCCLVGFATGTAVVLAFGASLVNLGTVYRYLVVALDHDLVDAPLIERPGRYLLGDLLDQSVSQPS
jgi:hypothetical protein